MSSEPSCPICARPRHGRGRDRQLCDACARRTVDAAGRRLRYYHPVTGGGVRGVYHDTGEVTDARICWVDGVACLADEVRFGGVVVVALPPAAARPVAA